MLRFPLPAHRLALHSRGFGLASVDRLTAPGLQIDFCLTDGRRAGGSRATISICSSFGGCPLVPNFTSAPHVSLHRLKSRVTVQRVAVHFATAQTRRARAMLPKGSSGKCDWDIAATEDA
eukprot:COSAG02_NODE_8602_length_2508_cov_4.831050_1_plen_119_part_10